MKLRNITISKVIGITLLFMGSLLGAHDAERKSYIASGVALQEAIIGDDTSYDLTFQSVPIASNGKPFNKAYDQWSIKGMTKFQKRGGNYKAEKYHNNKGEKEELQLVLGYENGSFYYYRPSKKLLHVGTNPEDFGAYIADLFRASPFSPMLWLHYETSFADAKTYKQDGYTAVERLVIHPQSKSRKYNIVRIPSRETVDHKGLKIYSGIEFLLLDTDEKLDTPFSRRLDIIHYNAAGLDESEKLMNIPAGSANHILDFDTRKETHKYE